MALSVAGVAMAAAPGMPSAGSVMQELPQAPEKAKVSAPQLRIQQGERPAASGQEEVPMRLEGVALDGVTLFDVQELIGISGFKPGSMTLSQVKSAASKIAEYYRSRGYFLAQAVIPPQDIKEGVIRIQVLEGQYGKISLQNASRLSPETAAAALGHLKQGDRIEAASLERGLLVLSDLPGVNAKATLSPGEAVGSSDLSVDLQNGPLVSGSVDADNQGNRYTGSNRVGATVNVNDPLGLGDALGLRAFGAPGGLFYGRMAYQAQVGQGNLGASWSGLNYHLGGQFSGLQAHGTGRIASVYGSYPLIRSRNRNLSIQLDFENKYFDDIQDATQSDSQKGVKDLVASLNGNYGDGFLGGGVTNYSLAWTNGKLDLQTAQTAALDATTAQSNGRFNKLSATVKRLQSLSPSTSLYLSISAQTANKNLDVSEKMELGGANGVRAYPEGEAYGDRGYLLNLEVRWLVPHQSDALPRQIQLVGFVDTGTVSSSINPWGGEPNSRTLSGAGLGLNLMTDSNWVAKAFLARKLGNATATSAPDAMVRGWVQLVKYF